MDALHRDMEVEDGLISLWSSHTSSRVEMHSLYHLPVTLLRRTVYSRYEGNIMEKATSSVVKRVLKLVRKREYVTAGTDPTEQPIDTLDLALLDIRYGSFTEEGFFRLLRNDGFGVALGVSLLLGLWIWTISNVWSWFR